MHISAVINQMLVLFLIMALGYVANRCKIMNDSSNRFLSKFMMNVTVPAMILSSVMETEISMDSVALLMIIAAAFLSMALLFLCGLAVSRILRVPLKDRGQYTFMTMFGNIGFMGFPVISSIFGNDAVFYGAIFLIPFNLLLFSLGVILISPRSDAKIDLSALRSPTMIASVIAVILFFLRLPIPGVISQTCQLVGDITTPGAMLLIGSTLALMPFKKMFQNWRIYIFTAIKLLALPVITWAVFHPFLSDALLLGVTVLNAAMPVATNTTMLCMEYGGNEPLASEGIFFTTVLSVATIPLIVFILL